MKYVATIVLAAAVGIHCSAPPVPGDDPSDEAVVGSDDIVAEPTSEPTNPSGSSESNTTPVEKSQHAFVALPSLVLSRVTGPDGATYVTGTYRDTIDLGGSIFTSTGKNDVFVARIEPSGVMSWARSVGSLSDESGPKVTFENNQLMLVATTRGAVDCGTGKLGKWSTEAFFMCVYGSDGVALNGASFPTGTK